MVRSCNVYHRIKHVVIPPSENYAITISKQTAIMYSGCQFKELIVDGGILLVKSGCDSVFFNKRM